MRSEPEIKKDLPRLMTTGSVVVYQIMAYQGVVVRGNPTVPEGTLLTQNFDAWQEFKGSVNLSND